MIFHCLAQTVTKTPDQIEDIKPLVAGSPSYWIVIVLGILLLLTIAAYFLWPNPGKKIVQPALPGELAREKLEAVKSRLGAESGYLLAVELSDILRGFIEQQFGIHARRQTTIEFLREMTKTSHIKPAHQERLRRFLDLCDPIKFAHLEANAQTSSNLFDQAWTFVEEAQ
jgi:hypothetical protein